ncbi:YdeI/OmpD-associated family protein [Chloroflexi bacterium TSY]|nr:YdeI/OmpD-associated family protein [Chloroflexi bacterium TSY]
MPTVWYSLNDPRRSGQCIGANPTTESHFYAFSDSSKKGILWWIKSAKTEATRQKRVAETVQLA